MENIDNNQLKDNHIIIHTMQGNTLLEFWTELCAAIKRLQSGQPNRRHITIRSILIQQFHEEFVQTSSLVAVIIHESFAIKHSHRLD
jgi:hypothetical protein